MSNRILIGCLLVGGCLVTALAIGQQPGPTNGRGTQFAVANSETSAILVEVDSGRTWVLTPSVDEHRSPAWLPIDRLDTEEEVAKWRAEEQVRGEQVGRRRQAASLRAKLEQVRKTTVVPENSAVYRQLQEQLQQLEANPSDP